MYGKDGGVDVFRDARHDAVVAELRRAQARENGMQSRDADEVQALIRATRPGKLLRMNRDSGYWIAEASPLAGHRALVRHWPVNDLAAVLLVTDGVSCGVDDYAAPPSWPAALDAALGDGLDDLLRSVHKAEAGDPNARRWPRGKRHDDKAAALLLWVPPDDLLAVTTQVFAQRVLDAFGKDPAPAVRQHDGVSLIWPNRS